MSRSRGCASVRSRPSTTSAPAVTSSSPAIIRNNVDLPHPDGPTRTRNSPSATSNQTSRTATTPFGYTFDRPWTEISATYNSLASRGTPRRSSTATALDLAAPWVTTYVTPSRRLALGQPNSTATTLFG